VIIDEVTLQQMSLRALRFSLDKHHFITALCSVLTVVMNRQWLFTSVRKTGGSFCCAAFCIPKEVLNSSLQLLQYWFEILLFPVTTSFREIHSVSFDKIFLDKFW